LEERLLYDTIDNVKEQYWNFLIYNAIIVIDYEFYRLNGHIFLNYEDKLFLQCENQSLISLACFRMHNAILHIRDDIVIYDLLQHLVNHDLGLNNKEILQNWLQTHVPTTGRDTLIEDDTGMLIDAIMDIGKEVTKELEGINMNIELYFLKNSNIKIMEKEYNLTGNFILKRGGTIIIEYIDLDSMIKEMEFHKSQVFQSKISFSSSIPNFRRIFELITQFDHRWDLKNQVQLWLSYDARKYIDKPIIQGINLSEKAINTFYIYILKYLKIYILDENHRLETFACDGCIVFVREEITDDIILYLQCENQVYIPYFESRIHPSLDWSSNITFSGILMDVIIHDLIPLYDREFFSAWLHEYSADP
jgi:hypothetical protein